MMQVNGYSETVFKNTEIGLIPADWDLQPLSFLAVVKYGKARPKSEGDIPVVGSSGVYAWAGTTLVDFSTIVIGRKGSAGQVWLITNPCWVADTAFYLDWKAEVDVGYLAAYLDLHKLSGEHAQTTMPSLQKPDLENLLVALPPLPEQQRIAAVLNAIQDEIAAQDDIISEARAFKRSLMQRLFTYGLGSKPAETKETEIGEIPAHWEVVEFGEVLELLQYGTSKRCDYETPGLPVLRIPNVIGGKIEPTDLKFAEFEPSEIQSLKLHSGDLLFVRTNGNRAYSGRSAVYHHVPSEALYASYLIRARFKPDTLLSDFAQAYTETPIGKGFLSGRATETADGKFNINTGTINTVIAPMPPICEQEEIINRLTACDEKIAIEEDRKAALLDFFKTMLHQLMTGQIRLQSDEGLPL